MRETGSYLEELRRRARKSRVYKPYQLTGLELSRLLGETTAKKKALYIKIAREYPAGPLLGLAKEISQNKRVTNKAAYFMSQLPSLKAMRKREKKPARRQLKLPLKKSK